MRFMWNASKMNDLLSKSSPEIVELAVEYAELSSRMNPSPDEDDRLGEILALATEDEVLSFWLTEIDHILAHHLGFLTDEARQSYEDQQALLREHRGSPIDTHPVPAALKQRGGKITAITGV